MGGEGQDGAERKRTEPLDAGNLLGHESSLIGKGRQPALPELKNMMLA
jgi:hypothetical protein